jgi:hypothetical protein
MTKDEAAELLHYVIIGLSKAGCSTMDIIEILQDRKVALCQLEQSMSHITKEKHHDLR